MNGKQIRNTRTERICPHCQGAGEITHNDSRRADPQTEYGEHCGECAGNGWIRTAPIDPLTKLRQARQFSRSSFGAMEYGVLRQRAVSPVCLPLDRVAEPARLAA